MEEFFISRGQERHHSSESRSGGVKGASELRADKEASRQGKTQWAGTGQGVKHSSNVGRWMRSEMAKETEGQRGQNAKGRQLVKGWGGRIWNQKELNASSHLCTYRNLHSWNSGRGQERGKEEGGEAKEGGQTQKRKTGSVQGGQRKPGTRKHAFRRHTGWVLA